MAIQDRNPFCLNYLIFNYVAGDRNSIWLSLRRTLQR
jgi:hypothetical protein